MAKVTWGELMEMAESSLRWQTETGGSGELDFLQRIYKRAHDKRAAALNPQPVAKPARPINQAEIDMLLGLEETAPGDGGQDGGRERRDAAPREDAEKEVSASDERTPSNAASPSTTKICYRCLEPIREGQQAISNRGAFHHAEGECAFDQVRGEGRGEGGDGNHDGASGGPSVLSGESVPSPQSPPPRTTEPICDCAIDPRFPDLHMPECSIASTTEPQADELKPPTFLSFSAACDQFAEYCRMAADFKHEFPGSAYRTRVDRAFDLIKRAYEVVCEADDRELGRTVSPSQPTPEVAELVKRLDGAVKMNKGDPSCRGMVALFSDAKDALERLSRDLLRTQEICIERGDKLIAQNVDLEAVRAERDAKERERSDLEAAIWEYADLLGVKKASEIRHAINSLKAQSADALEREKGGRAEGFYAGAIAAKSFFSDGLTDGWLGSFEKAIQFQPPTSPEGN